MMEATMPFQKGNHPKSEFKKGSKPWNTDTKGLLKLGQGFQKGHGGFRTKESYIKAGKKISKAKKGKKILSQCGFQKGHPNYLIHHTEKVRRKLSKNHKGEKGSNWIDGRTPKNKRLRRGIKFKLWREFVFQYDNWTCWICEERGGKLHPHHLKSFSKYPKLRFKKSNGLTLCEFCHKTYTNYGK